MAAKATPKRKTAVRKVPSRQRAGASAKPKAGRSADAAALRRTLFVERYLSNGHNATDAAIAAGVSSRGARKAGWEMLHEPAVAQRIQARAREVAQLAELTTAEWLREVACIARVNPGELFGTDGQMIPVQLLPPHVQAAIASVKFKDGRVSEIKFWDKNAALVTAARHLGLFEKDNAQLAPSLALRVNLV